MQAFKLKYRSVSSQNPRHKIGISLKSPSRLKNVARTTIVSYAQSVYSNYVSHKHNLESAIEEAVTQALEGIPPCAIPEDDINLALIFCSSAFGEEYESVVRLLKEQVPSVKHVFGCSGAGIIGMTKQGAEELESVPGISITLTHLHKTNVILRHVAMAELPDADAPPKEWCNLLGLTYPNDGDLSLVILADPSFLRVQELFAGLDFALPHATKIGGLSSAGVATPDRALFCWNDPSLLAVGPSDSSQKMQQPEHGVHRTGAVIMALQGGLRMELMVAQGCRPLSSTTWTVEVVERATNRILALKQEVIVPVPLQREKIGGSSSSHDVLPVEALQCDLRGHASTQEELDLLLGNLMLGLSTDNMKSSLDPQDFLIRPFAIDGKGYMAVGDLVRVGQRCRFMARDQQGAIEDLQNHGMGFKRKELEQMLGSGSNPPLGTMIFSCNGRGSNLYPDRPSYDSQTISSFIPVPSCGFLCNGEIATGMGNTTQLHGFTCVVGVLRPVAEASLIENCQNHRENKDSSNRNSIDVVKED